MSRVERFLKSGLVKFGKGIEHGIPPQFADNQTIKDLLSEAEKSSESASRDLVIKILTTYSGILSGDIKTVDEQIKITLGMIAGDNKNPDLWCHLAAMEKTRQNIDAAKVDFQIALSLNPNHSDANYNFANLLASEGDLVGAEKHYRKCIQIDPNDFNAHNNLGDVLRRARRFDEGELELKKAITIFPMHFKAYNNLGGLYANCGRLEEAKRCFRKALEINPDYQIASENLAKILAFQSKRKG